MTSIWVGSSVNLYHGCPDLILADVAPIWSEMQQSIGRIYRLGQSHTVNAYFLTLDYSCDRVLHDRSTRKMMGQIAAQASISLTKEDNALL